MLIQTTTTQCDFLNYLGSLGFVFVTPDTFREEMTNKCVVLQELGFNIYYETESIKHVSFLFDNEFIFEQHYAWARSIQVRDPKRYYMLYMKTESGILRLGSVYLDGFTLITIVPPNILLEHERKTLEDNN